MYRHNSGKMSRTFEAELLDENIQESSKSAIKMVVAIKEEYRNTTS